MNLLMEELRFAKGIDPVADAFAGTVYSDVYSMRGYGNILFVIYAGVGATGTSTLTVEACDNVTPSNQTAIVFWYREMTATDVEGAITKATTAGYITTAGSSKIILVEAKAADVAAASVNSLTGNQFVRLKAVESVDNPVLGGIHVVLGGDPSRYVEDVKTTVLA